MSNPHAHEHSVVETLQSLVVAFVLAMIFRGFVTEGFVIPTGSMAPTLMGQHLRINGMKTGWEFAVGVDPARTRSDNIPERYKELPDPMLGIIYPGTATKDPMPQYRDGRVRARMGDRILVLKSLYPFSEPDRFDVVVFKNPTDPIGPAENYIKRLIGLPGEAIWLADGDVFVGDAASAADYAAYSIRRKPEHVQRAVWQPVFDSDYVPWDPSDWDVASLPYQGSPWSGGGWEMSGTRYICDRADPSVLVWDSHILQLTDWTPYNMASGMYSVSDAMKVSDLRVAATIVPETAGLVTRLVITAQQTTYEFTIGDGSARMRYRDAAWGDDFPDEGWESGSTETVDALEPGRPTRVEFWHVDQAMWLFVNGHRVGEPLAYEWGPELRLQNAVQRGEDADMLAGRPPTGEVQLHWHFAGSPLSLHHVQVDRDLYYRTDRRGQDPRNPSAPEWRDIFESPYPYGTHPDNVAILGPDHFFMCGDNSTASSDSRLWGNPHPLVATQIDPHPFVVNRKLMLGKAWVVYFPAPLSAWEGSTPFVPDFGELRFIR